MLTKTKKKNDLFLNVSSIMQSGFVTLISIFFSLLTIVTMQMQISLNEILGKYVAASS